MRRRLVVAAVAAAGLAAAIPAPGASSDLAWKVGNHKGKTAQGFVLRFRAGQQSVYNIAFKYRMKCSDGVTFQGRQEGYAAPFYYDEGVRFDRTSRSASGATAIRFRGRISGSKASGKLALAARYDENDNPDPKGSVQCVTGTVKWSTKRVTSSSRSRAARATAGASVRDAPRPVPTSGR
jgi:hypothetical protein